jgi:hypothetical protein
VRNWETAVKISNNNHTYPKHIQERFDFLGRIDSVDGLRNHIFDVLENPTLSKTMSNGDTLYYHEPSNSVVWSNPNSSTGGTCFQSDLYTPGRMTYNSRLYFDNTNY